jgi:small ligand-binding sensory domain FIST
LLFVSPFHAEEFQGIVHLAWNTLNEHNDDNNNIQFLALVGGGVIGGNQEYDDAFGPPAMSLLSGVLPVGANAVGFCSTPDDDYDNFFAPTPTARSSSSSSSSHIVFCDPWADTERLLNELATTTGTNDNDVDVVEDVIIGGISCPIMSDRYPTLPSVAWNGEAYPKGSAVGVSFLTGTTFGLQAVVAQGCRPLGPTFTVTSASGNILNGLDGISALPQLQRVAQEASDSDKILIQRGGILCGVTAVVPTTKMKDDHDDDDETQPQQQDYLIRQITGMIQSEGEGGEGAIAIGVRDLREGDQFQFHVRDAKAAQEDMKVMVQRTKTERLFAGPQQVGVPVAALQVSCVARGRGLFGNPNVDLEQVNQLLGLQPQQPLQKMRMDDTDDNEGGVAAAAAATRLYPVAGFFANGEIGPVGISGFGSSTALQGTHIHGFTTVVGLFCDFSGSTDGNNNNNNNNNAETKTAVELSSSSEEEEEAWG